MWCSICRRNLLRLTTLYLLASGPQVSLTAETKASFEVGGTAVVPKEAPATSPVQQEVLYGQVIAVATSWSHPNVLRLLRTSPYATRIIGIGYKEQRHGVKLDLALKQVQAESDQNKVLMFIDAFDTLIQGGDHDICTRNISQAFRSAGVDILFEAEIGCFAAEPVCEAMREAHPKGKAGEKPYLNSGVYLGTVKAIMHILETKFIPWKKKHGVSDSDQKFWYEMFAKQEEQLRANEEVYPRLGIDYEETISTSMKVRTGSAWDAISCCQDNKITHLVDGRHIPLACLVHANLESKEEKEELLDRLYSINKSQFDFQGSQRLQVSLQVGEKEHGALPL